MPRESMGAIVGGPAFRAGQLYEACARTAVVGSHAWNTPWSLEADLGTATSLPASTRATLADERYVCRWGEAQEVQRSGEDGTIKLLVGLAGADGSTSGCGEVEAVVIPAHVAKPADGPAGGAPGSVCVSSQVGCSFRCRFCRTGTQAFERNLSGGQIAGQVMLAAAALEREHARDAAASGRGPAAVPCPSRVRSVVFMGQGEPLMNWEGVSGAIDVLTDPRGPLGMSRRRITVSTVGVSPRIPAVADAGARLAVSLHSAVDATRTAIMPTNARFPLATVQAACADYLARARAMRGREGRSGGRHDHWARISLEVTLLRGVNDDLESDTEALARFAAGLGQGAAHVNLIPFNPWPGTTVRAATKARLLRFAERLRARGVQTTIRATRGRDILAACGQLHSEMRRG